MASSAGEPGGYTYTEAGAARLVGTALAYAIDGADAMDTPRM